MEIGAADIIEEPVERKPRKRALSGSSGSSGNGSGKNPGGGGDGPDDGDRSALEPFRPGISRILTGFLLLVVMMTFGGLIAAYLVISTNNVAEWRPFDLPLPVWISTALIIASSVTYHFGKSAVDRGSPLVARKWFTVTTVIGAAFISSQLLAWVELSARGLYMSANPYAGFFFLLTAVHAVHVLGGIIALGAIFLRTLRLSNTDEDVLRWRSLAQVVGWYWHFMGVLWLVIFILLGYWK
jgi:cytochrome c oxidase subunit III